MDCGPDVRTFDERLHSARRRCALLAIHVGVDRLSLLGPPSRERATKEIASLRRGLADAKADRVTDMDEFLDELESQP